MKDFDGDAWLTPAQAALRLGVTPLWIRRLADRGDLVVQRTPLGRLISAHSIEEYAQVKNAGDLPKGGRPVGTSAPKKAAA